MNAETTFFQKVSERRVSFGEVGRPGFRERAVLYINAACSYAKALELTEFPIKKVTISDSEEIIQLRLLELEMYMDDIRAENLYILEPNLQEVTVRLNQDWKAKATTFVDHVRKIVKDAEMEEGLRESIFASLNQLQRSIDRNRTPLDSFVETWLKITKAIDSGAKNLDNAVKLTERIRKLFTVAKNFEIDAEENPRLPPPDEALGDGGED